MTRKCIEQTTCVACDKMGGNLTVTDSDMNIDEGTVTYDTRCSCGESGTLMLTISDIVSAESLHHDDASWNQEIENV